MSFKFEKSSQTFSGVVMNHETLSRINICLHSTALKESADAAASSASDYKPETRENLFVVITHSSLETPAGCKGNANSRLRSPFCLHFSRRLRIINRIESQRTHFMSARAFVKLFYSDNRRTRHMSDHPKSLYLMQIYLSRNEFRASQKTLADDN